MNMVYKHNLLKQDHMSEKEKYARSLEKSKSITQLPVNSFDWLPPNEQGRRIPLGRIVN